MATVSAVTTAKPFREEVKSRIDLASPPKLVGLLANKDPAAKKYAEWTGRACQEDNIAYELREVDAMDLEKALHDANRDPDVHGIIIYYPVFGAEPSFDGGSMDNYLRDSIVPEKDVEGLCHLYRSNLYRNIRFMDSQRRCKCLLPCTPLAVVKILEAQGVYDLNLPEGARLQGKSITVVNRSEIVGRPLAALLANDGATVYSVDIDSVYKVQRGSKCEIVKVTMEEACRLSQVVVLGVPAKQFKLPAENIKPGTLVVNVASFKNVDPVELKKIEGVKFCSAVGKVTVAMLERNLLRLYENFHRPLTDSNTREGSLSTKGAAAQRDATNIVIVSAVVCAVCTLVSSATLVLLASKAFRAS